MNVDGANECLRKALDTDDAAEKKYHMRQALQLLATE